jgi:hypothetical protein
MDREVGSSKVVEVDVGRMAGASEDIVEGAEVTVLVLGGGGDS